MRKLLLLCFVVMLGGCSISRNVQPVDSTVEIKKIYVRNNAEVHMKELNGVLVEIFQELGFQSELYNADRPADAKHYLTYTANWKWDLAMYLVYFRGTLYEDGRVLGEVEYDAQMGGANFEKFGKTKEKIKPLMEQLLAGGKGYKEGSDDKPAAKVAWDSGDQLPDGQYDLILSQGIGHSVCSEHFSEGKQQAFSVENGTVKQERSPFIRVRSSDIKIHGEEFSGDFVGPFIIQSKAAMRFKGHRMDNGFQGHYTASTGSLVCDGKFQLLRRAQ